MKKRLVFCFDGTWNRLSADNPTNVVLLAQMVTPTARDGVPQIVYYDEGVGTQTYFAARLYQGIVGKGLEANLREAYRFLIFNYAAGDEIFIFGFSRGAFTARSFAGFIRHAGILDVVSATKIDQAIAIYKKVHSGQWGKELPDALEFRREFCKSVCVSDEDLAYRRERDCNPELDLPRLDIRYLGVWDTVGALGIPEKIPFSRYANREHGFHDTLLTSKIRAARHAVALDERRWTFPPVLFGRARVEELNAMAAEKASKPFEEWTQPYQERWFPGVHGAIGGGGKHRGLSDAALHWVLSGARRAGLELRASEAEVVFAIRPDPLDPIFNDPPKWTKRLQAKFHALVRATRGGPEHEDEIALGTFQRWHRSAGETPYRPRSLAKARRFMDQWAYREAPQWKYAAAGEDPLQEHRLGSADTLSTLARDRLGDAKRWRELFDLNRDRIDDPDYLPTDVVLRMPKPSPPGGA